MYIVADNTEPIVFTPDATPDPQPTVSALVVTDATPGAAPGNLTIGTLTAGVLTVQSDALAGLIDHTLRFAWKLTRLGQTATVVEYYDVFEAAPSVTPLVTVAQCLTRLRVSLPKAPEVADLMRYASVLVEQEVGSSLESIVVAEQVPVGMRDSELRLRNRPVKTVTAIIDPYGAEYEVGAWLLDVKAAVLRRYFLSPGQNAIAAMFGAQNAALMAGGSVQQSDMPPLIQGTWSVTYEGGLENDPRWERVIKPDLAWATLMAVQDFHDVRTSRATSEKEGDHSHALDLTDALPCLAAARCRKYSLGGV